MTPVASITALLAASAAALSAQQSAPPFASRNVQAAFLSAYNTGTPGALRTFVRDFFESGTGTAGERAVSFWQALRLEVGPLELVAQSREARSNRTAEIFWYRGLTTGAYPGIELTLDTGASPRVRSYGVNRALRPAAITRPPAVPDADLRGALDRYFRAAADSGHFSGTVVVTRRGEPIFEGAYGPNDLAAGRRNTLDTPFRLASVTKLFTGVAILQLVDRGRVALSDPVSRFIPEYPTAIARQVTVRHLLTHTSGIELDGDSAYIARVSAARSVDDLVKLQIERLSRLSPDRLAEFRPLDNYDYTNEGIDLLAAIVERVSGQRWSAYLAEHVFRPAGMTHSGADFLAPVPGVPVGYSSASADGDRGATRAPVPELRGPIAAVRPAGSGYASARDLVSFMRALTNGTLLRPETARAMMSAQVEVPSPPGMRCRRAYGYAMTVMNCPGGENSVGHTGSTLGQSTVVDYFPASETTVVILSNFDRVTWWAETRLLEMLGLR